MPGFRLEMILSRSANRLGLCASQPNIPFRYPEGKYERGELAYIHDIPVLAVEGLPREIGEQVAVLALLPAQILLGYPMDVLRRRLPIGDKLRQKVFEKLVQKGRLLRLNFPEHHRAEFEALANFNMDRDPLLAANTMFDLKNVGLRELFGCSSLIVNAEHTATGKPLFGRNLDFFSCGYLHAYSLVTVYRQKDKKAFVCIGFPGFIGCISGMNDAGLCLASHDVFTPTPDRKFNPNGTPFALCYRRLLEECCSVDEAIELLKKMERTTSTLLVLCDKEGGATLELTPDNVIRRSMVNGFCTCTNHFTSKQLSAKKQDNVYRTLDRQEKLQNIAPGEKLGIKEMQQRLHSVNQGDLTIQTMIFEPEHLKIHLAIGDGPSSRHEMKTLDFGLPASGRKGPLSR